MSLVFFIFLDCYPRFLGFLSFSAYYIPSKHFLATLMLNGINIHVSPISNVINQSWFNIRTFQLTISLLQEEEIANEIERYARKSRLLNKKVDEYVDKLDFIFCNVYYYFLFLLIVLQFIKYD